MNWLAFCMSLIGKRQVEGIGDVQLIDAGVYLAESFGDSLTLDVEVFACHLIISVEIDGLQAVEGALKPTLLGEQQIAFAQVRAGLRGRDGRRFKALLVKAAAQVVV